MTGEQREILETLVDFAEENWEAFSQRYEERTGQEIKEELFNTMTQI